VQTDFRKAIMMPDFTNLSDTEVAFMLGFAPPFIVFWVVKIFGLVTNAILKI
jgi:hypothetical protein